ncbi:MAG: hypothetical protein IJ939_01515, partial [Clostridia bacterium]|nr:hypothetical protein [Clostridia bacterium]
KLSFIATERIGGALLMIVLASLCFGFLILTLHLAEKISEKRAKNALLSENSNEIEKNAFTVLSPGGKTASKFLRVIVSPMMLASIAIFIVAAFVKL